MDLFYTNGTGSALADWTRKNGESIWPLSDWAISQPNGTSLWQACATRLVAFGSMSSGSEVAVYTEVAFWKVQNISTSEFHPYIEYNGTLSYRVTGITGVAYPDNGSNMPDVGRILRNTSRTDDLALCHLFYKVGTDNYAPGDYVESKTARSAWAPSGYRYSGYTSSSANIPMTRIIYHGESNATITNSVRYTGGEDHPTEGFTLTVKDGANGAAGTKQNYRFSGWQTSGGTIYQVGSTYSGDEDLHLYASWTPVQTTQTFNVNTPSGATGSAVVISGDLSPKTKQPTIAYDLPILGTSFTPTYKFLGWANLASATEPDYGTQYNSDISRTLYAVWRSAYRTGIIDVSVSRPDPSSTDVIVSGNVISGYIEGSSDEERSYQNVYSVEIRSKAPSASQWTVETTIIFDQTSPSSTAEYSYTSTGKDAGVAWDFMVVFLDTYSKNYPTTYNLYKTKNLPSSFITFAGGSKGHSFAIGRSASDFTSASSYWAKGLFEIGMATKFLGDVDFSSSTSVIGLPINIATTSAVGVVKPDGTTIGVDSAGKISVLSGGLTCTERRGGVTLDQVKSYPNPGWGWREERWSDGRLTLYVWDWFSLSAVTSYKSITYPSSATAFSDEPFSSVIAVNTSSYVYNDAIATSIVNRTTSAITVGVRRTNSCAKVILEVKLEGHWDTSGEEEVSYFAGPYDVTPTFSVQTLSTANKKMLGDVSIEGIQETEEDNSAGGQTLTI